MGILTKFKVGTRFDLPSTNKYIGICLEVRKKYKNAISCISKADVGNDNPIIFYFTDISIGKYLEDSKIRFLDKDWKLPKEKTNESIRTKGKTTKEPAKEKGKAGRKTTRSTKQRKTT